MQNILYALRHFTTIQAHILIGPRVCVCVCMYASVHMLVCVCVCVHLCVSS